ncbi:hypothetical protein FQN60_017903 [Etheostoma spectabile]|uniref:Chemokine interleukin-8-like domain-containing protein n=1 Tax=Etheostoma spectabile TaxID=54343 RepID=A0A5J5DGL3_9PERO|nr:hypothetical protein FQN60_017903 [Etheostoma spectabile]
MTTKPLLLLAALTFCFCIASLHGNCRRTEIIVTRRNGSRVCVNPNVQWVNDLLRSFRNTNVSSSATTVSTTASTIHY